MRKAQPSRQQRNQSQKTGTSQDVGRSVKGGGGDGIDTFGYAGRANANGSDTIADYTLGATKADSDKIHLCGNNGTPTHSGADSGSDHVITVSLGTDTVATITLQGITSSSANFASLDVVVINTGNFCD